MSHFHHDHLTIFDAHEVNFYNPGFLGLLVLVKLPVSAYTVFPPDVPFEINRATIQVAIQQKSQILVPIESISRHMFDYLVLAPSHAAATRIMALKSIIIADQYLAIFPWTPQYGSTTVPFDPSIPMVPTPAIPPTSLGNNEPLSLTIYGLPPHLCVRPVIIISRIFANICQVSDVRLNRHDLSISANTYAPRLAIPRLASIGIRRQRVAGDLVLHMWPLWIKVRALPPGNQQTNQHQADEWSNNLIRYTLYEQSDGGQDAGTSTQGGADRGQRQIGLFIESLGDSPREGSHDDTLGTSITPVEITPPGDLDDLDDARTTYHG
ncbi:hypothetical protein PVAP13_3KG041900 [Panicum virgatum]|uniref:Uncharacterized protein n=1 Tax=Panicum virgatum TaxID=38727 RepID=A0A8T0UPB9_PANVG|nr:hypothetical protein PVAP13_3KG041900 [Panicum virgatum]